jgi:hypothetical protein
LSGIHFANRWVRKPRPEASLPLALKSFDDKYRLYLYPSLPFDHILLTPAGVIALETTNLAGRVSLREGQETPFHLQRRWNRKPWHEGTQREVA